MKYFISTTFICIASASLIGMEQQNLMNKTNELLQTLIDQKAYKSLLYAQKNRTYAQGPCFEKASPHFQGARWLHNQVLELDIKVAQSTGWPQMSHFHRQYNKNNQ